MSYSLLRTKYPNANYIINSRITIFKDKMPYVALRVKNCSAEPRSTERKPCSTEQNRVMT